MELAGDLKARGFAEHTTAPLESILAKKRGVYLGIDPTADSLHVGHLVPILLMKRLMDAGHRGIFLVGGGTGMIGDPREAGERSLLDAPTLARNTRAIRTQLQKIVGKKVTMVDNASWLGKLNLIEFLRDIGKHFTVNELVKRDLIKRRLATPDESISFTEFSYALLQGYDFYTLYQKKGIDLQVGGADQWTNMLSGVDLIRKKLGKEAYVFTAPLVTDANGKKFGKSEGNPVWLDPQKTSPFAFYQFWIGLPDEGLETYLKLYTFLSLDEIATLMELHKRRPADREAQETLARLVTEVVHGPAAAAQAAAATDALYGGRPLGGLSREERAVVLAEAPNVPVRTGQPILEALVAGKLATSKSDARRLMAGRAVSLNGAIVSDADQTLASSDFADGLAMLRKGRDIALLVLK